MKAKVIKHTFINQIDEPENEYYAKYKLFLFWRYIKTGDGKKKVFHTLGAATNALTAINDRIEFKRSHKDEVIDVEF